MSSKLIKVFASIAVINMVNAMDVAEPGRAIFDRHNDERRIKGELLRLVTQEEKGIWAAMFTVDDPKLAKLWATCHTEKGLKGCLLTNMSKQNIPFVDVVLKGHVPVKMVNLGQPSYYMHNKFIIFKSNQGGPLVVTGSSNLTDASFNDDCNAIVLIRNMKTIKHYVASFIEMAENRSKVNGKNVVNHCKGTRKEFAKKELEELLSLPVLNDDCYREARFNHPNNKGQIEELITSLFDAEQSSIDSAQFVFTLEQLATTWIKKGGTLIIHYNFKMPNFEGDEYSVRIAKKNARNRLNGEKKVAVYAIDMKGLMHHKFLLFRNNKHNKPVVLLGSANLSTSSLNNCWENVF